jgi:hypothetical protein
MIRNLIQLVSFTVVCPKLTTQEDADDRCWLVVKRAIPKAVSHQANQNLTTMSPNTAVKTLRSSTNLSSANPAQTLRSSITPTSANPTKKFSACKTLRTPTKRATCVGSVGSHALGHEALSIVHIQVILVRVWPCERAIEPSPTTTGPPNSQRHVLSR